MDYTDRIIDLFGEDIPERFVRPYHESVLDDTGKTVENLDEVVVSTEFLEELLMIAEFSKKSFTPAKT